jgi:inosose dehydratase
MSTEPSTAPLGAQSYSFREFDLAGSLACLRELGLRHMEFCGVHFPPDAGHPALPGVKEALDGAEVLVPCYGVEAFTGDADADRGKFMFARELGIKVLTADPEPESLDILDRLCGEFRIKIGIHNHGPGARYDKVQDTLKAVRNRHPFIGACVDTGHAIRSGEAPHEVIRQLGDRVHSLHLKDWTHGGDERIVGEGDLDLEAVARELRNINFSGPIMFEYEQSPDNPVPAMRQGLENWRRVWE